MDICSIAISRSSAVIIPLPFPGGAAKARPGSMAAPASTPMPPTKSRLSINRLQKCEGDGKTGSLSRPAPRHRLLGCDRILIRPAIRPGSGSFVHELADASVQVRYRRLLQRVQDRAIEYA